MFDMKSKKSVMGIDIGSRFTKLVKIGVNKNQPQLEICDCVPVGSLDADFERLIHDHLKKRHVLSALAASTIDDPSMKIRKVEAPKMPDADLVEAVKWNLRDIVEDDIDKYYVTWSLIREFVDAEARKVEVVAYAIKKDAVVAHQRLIERVGLNPCFIEPASVSLAATLENCLGVTEDYVAGVNVGYHQTLFYIIGKGVFVFSRPMLGIHLQAQEKEPSTFFQKLAIEVQKSIDTFKVNCRMEDVKSLYLSGGGALLPGLVDYLNTNLGMATRLLNPLASFGITEATEEIKPAVFAQALGLATIHL